MEADRVATVIYGNSFALRLGMSDVALLVAAKIDPPPQLRAEDADVVVYMSLTAAKQTAQALQKLIDTYEAMTDTKIPTEFPPDAEAKVRASLGGQPGFEVKRAGGGN